MKQYTADGEEIKDGMTIYLDTPEGRIEGIVLFINHKPPKENCVHVMFEVCDPMGDELDANDSWWPLHLVYAKPN